MSAARPWAAVPVKNIRDAKQRLSSALTPSERGALFRAMLEDVLCTLLEVSWLGGILVVTRDAEVQTLARRHGVSVLAESENRGQTSAVTAAAGSLLDRTDTMLSIPADLPLVSPSDLEAMRAAHGVSPAITLAPAHDGRGTNAVLCSPPDVLSFHFGNDSFEPHREEARAEGIEPRIVKCRGLGLDIDNPADLEAFLAEPSKTRAYAWLQSSGVASRLCPAGPAEHSVRLARG